MSQRLLRTKRKITNAGDPLPRPLGRPARRAHRWGARSGVPDLQRGLRPERRPSRGRGDAPRPTAGRPDAGGGRGARSAGPDHLPDRPPRHAVRCRRGPGADGGAGPRPVGPGADRRGDVAPAPGGGVRSPTGAVLAPGPDRGRHATAGSPQDTDWARIVALYDALLAAQPSPVVALNRAVAIGFRDGYDAGLSALDALTAPGPGSSSPGRLLPAAGGPGRLPAPARAHRGGSSRVPGGTRPRDRWAGAAPAAAPVGRAGRPAAVGDPHPRG